MTGPQHNKHWDGPPLTAWAAWSPAQVTDLLTGTGVAWCVVGGWAIDLFLNVQTRTHGDLEIAIARADFAAMRKQLARFEVRSIGDGEVWRIDDTALPPPHRHQNWVLDIAADVWRLDVMLEPGDNATWIFRRDKSIRTPRASMVSTTRAGIPFLKPEGVLLYKAKAQRPKDEADFNVCLPHLDAAARRWLMDALQRAHPGHPWLTRLAQ